MPVVSFVDPERRLVVSRAIGVLTDRDLAEHHRTIRRTRGFEPTFSQIYDFRDVERVEVTTTAVERFSGESPFGAGARRAFVAGSDLVFGLARMYQALVEPQGHVLRVFRDFDEACAWLGVDPTTLPVPGRAPESA